MQGESIQVSNWAAYGAKDFFPYFGRRKRKHDLESFLFDELIEKLKP